MATDAAGVEGMVVEEVPHPPIYYNLSALGNGDCLRPPQIPSQNDTEIASNQYGGSAAMQLHTSRAFDEQRNYKIELHRELANVLKFGLSLVSGNVDNETLPLANSLQSIHDMLAEYQVHEAREVVLMDMKAKIKRLREMKEVMERLLDRVEQAQSS